MAKALLKRRGLQFEEINLQTQGQDAVVALFQKSGMRTVPQIFADDELIGGYTDLAELDSKDQLQSLQ